MQRQSAYLTRHDLPLCEGLSRLSEDKDGKLVLCGYRSKRAAERGLQLLIEAGRGNGVRVVEGECPSMVTLEESRKEELMTD